jgi:RimJ/RimL family protein N-acetyltransferase
LELLTARLVLRDLRADDFGAVHAYSSDAETVKYEGEPYDEQGTRDFINYCVREAAASPRTGYGLAVTLRDGGALIGNCGIELDRDDDSGSVGWTLHSAHWRRGYGYETARALLSFGFGALKLHRVTATCDCENRGSIRIMEKCGMRREGVTVLSRRAATALGGGWRNGYTYAILADEWKPCA